MVVPIYKQWTANIIRLQVVEQDNIIQLLAFFEEFSHADAMNFQLRVTDTFEKTDKGGKFGLKLVDAKFALPVEERRGEGKMQKEEGRLTGWAGTKRKFVCLDEIEYPGEHDDILIQFDSAESKFCQVVYCTGTDNMHSTRYFCCSTTGSDGWAEVHRSQKDIDHIDYIALQGSRLRFWFSLQNGAFSDDVEVWFGRGVHGVCCAFSEISPLNRIGGPAVLGGHFHLLRCDAFYSICIGIGGMNQLT